MIADLFGLFCFCKLFRKGTPIFKWTRETYRNLLRGLQLSLALVSVTTSLQLMRPQLRTDESHKRCGYQDAYKTSARETVYAGALEILTYSTMTSYCRTIQSNRLKEVSSPRSTEQLIYLDRLSQLEKEIENQKPKNPPKNISKKHSIPSGPHLTKQSGVFNGPSGKETYYNLNMSGVVRILQRSGIDGYFWVRSDGVKMWGDYVMCAADLSIRPRGSLVNTSLGKGIVVDTGTFIYSNRAQLDIAVTW